MCSESLRISTQYFVFLAKNMYDIQEYSFSQTTLEQVYLKFAHYENTDAFENITTWTKRVKKNYTLIKHMYI